MHGAHGKDGENQWWPQLSRGGVERGWGKGKGECDLGEVRAIAIQEKKQQKT